MEITTMMIHPIVSVWLLLVILIPLIIACVLLWWQNRRESAGFHWVIRSLVLVCLFLVAIRPNIAGGSGNAGAANVDIYFVVDTTTSMIAEDYVNNAPRLNGVGTDIAKIVKGMAGARYSLITFGNDARVALPLTTDASAIVSASHVLYPEITYYAKGSSISQPLDLVKSLLEKSQKISPERQRFVYYFGDGEQTMSDSPRSFAPIAPLIDGGGVFGYGTDKGGKMQEISGYEDDSSTKRYIKDYSQSGSIPDAVSKIDEENLRSIATDMKVAYIYAGAGADIDSVIGKIDFSKLTPQNRDVSLREDIYWIPAIVLVLLLGIEIWYLIGHTFMSRYGKGEKS